jgi:hypothetical protein
MTNGALDERPVPCAGGASTSRIPFRETAQCSYLLRHPNTRDTRRAAQMSRFFTNCALASMNTRRGSTSSPINVWKI